MKRHRNSCSVLSSGRNCLGHTCGTNIDTEGIDFTDPRPNLVYMDKVFSFNEDVSCPLLLNLNTGGANAGNFITEVTLQGPGSNLFPCELGPDAVFTVDNTFVAVEYFNTRPPGNINATQVTLDGYPVDSVSYSNGQYTAKTANVLPKVQKDRCVDRGLPTKAFFLINHAGPWNFRAKYVLEGTVNSGGRTCRFRIVISNAPDSSNTSLPQNSVSSFAVPGLSLPCSINGIAPDVVFQFNAKISLVNPQLSAVCGIPMFQPPADTTGTTQHCCPPCPPCPPYPPCPPVVSVILDTVLAVEPTVHVETIRRTLFCSNACEGLQPCQGSLVAAEIEDDEEDCLIGGVDRPDCRCCSNRSAGVSPCRIRRESDAEDIACGGFDVGGLTVGAGNCDECEEVAGSRTCEDILSDLADLLGTSSCCGDASGGTGLAPDGTYGWNCDAVRANQRRNTTNNKSSNRVRTAFQFNGCNGCSW